MRFGGALTRRFGGMVVGNRKSEIGNGIANRKIWNWLVVG